MCLFISESGPLFFLEEIGFICLLHFADGKYLPGAPVWLLLFVQYKMYLSQEKKEKEIACADIEFSYRYNCLLKQIITL